MHHKERVLVHDCGYSFVGGFDPRCTITYVIPKFGVDYGHIWRCPKCGDYVYGDDVLTLDEWKAKYGNLEPVPLDRYLEELERKARRPRGSWLWGWVLNRCEHAPYGWEDPVERIFCSWRLHVAGATLLEVIIDLHYTVELLVRGHRRDWLKARIGHAHDRLALWAYDAVNRIWTEAHYRLSRQELADAKSWIASHVTP